MALFALTISAFSAPASVSMAQSLPEPLRPIGNLSSPYNLLVPNYKEAPPISSWQGFYIKPSVGYDSISFGGSQLHAAKGITLGLSGGYDFRYNNFVFGPVGDLNYDFLRSDDSGIGGVYGYNAHIAFDGSARAMAGYLWDRTLIYATAGYAFANVNVNSPIASDSRMLSGWTAGGGVEYLWNEHNAIRVEYRLVQFPGESFDSLPANNDRIKFNMNKFDVGFVHKF